METPLSLRDTKENEMMPTARVQLLHAARARGTVVQSIGEVIAKPNDRSCDVEADGARYRAAVAASCLLQPERGDRVLLVLGHEGSNYVLAVLERNETSPNELSLDGETTLRVRRGRLRVASDRSIDLLAPDAVAVTSSRLDVRAAVGDLLIDALEYVGNQVKADAHAVSVTAGVLDTVADRVSQRVSRLYRKVTDLEHVRVGQYDLAAVQNVRMHAKNALLTAMALVKVDGEQIHMG